MKTILTVIVIAIGCLIFWFAAGNRSDTLKAAADNLKMSVEESVLPEIGKTGDAAVIRKAMIEQRKKENAEWTAGNIHARPDLYLAHCQKMLTSYSEQYGAAILETKASINKCAREISNAEEASKSLWGFLKAAQTALSDANLQYPAKVGVYTYEDANKVRGAVLKSDKKLSECEALIAEKKRSAEELKVALSSLEKGKERVDKELRDLRAKMEQVKSSTITKHVDSIRDRVDALLSGIDALPELETAAPSVGGVLEPAETAEDVFSRRKLK